MAKTFVESEQSGRVDVLEALLLETCGAALEVARIANCAGFLRSRSVRRARRIEAVTITIDPTATNHPNGCVHAG
ncbi:MAG TPA: hypothetical protein VJ301_03545 [Propionibacteriaceae bacterium]|nr:hypothetical protein [Propionibacteriaceae bacterium]